MSAPKATPRAQRLPELLAGLATGVPKAQVTGVETDSRRVQPGDLFLACKGYAGHGMNFLDQAIENGASAVAWEPAPGMTVPEGLPAVAVPCLAAQAGEIAARFFGRPSARLFTVGITGTDGKTSTTYLITQALDRLGEPCVYLGTLGYGRLTALRDASHTTPDPVRLQRLLADFVESGARACAMEVSSHALDQDRVAGMKFDAAVLTNIGRDHLDYHGDIPSYAAAKHKLFKRPELKAAVLNGDDSYGRAWCSEHGGNGCTCILYRVGGQVASGGKFLLAENLDLSPDGLSFDLRSSWGAAKLRTRLLGRFNAYNLLAAMAVLIAKGVKLADAVDALSKATTVPGRIEGYRGPAARPLVVVDYAHTPQALAQILQALRAHTRGKLWCVFGCGGDRDRGKRPLMGAAAAEHADVLIVTDDNPRSEKPDEIVAEIVAGIVAGLGEKPRVVHDRAQAITAAVREAGPDDVVVVAGKGHETTQTYGTEVRAFSDRSFVAQLVGQEARA